MELSIIIVSYNVAEILESNLKSVLNSSYKDFEIIVIDNASEDNSLDIIGDNFPEIKLIKNEINLGFAKAVNQGIKISQGKYILLLNPDMELLPDSLEKTISWIKDNPQAVITGPRLIKKNKETIPSVRRFPRLCDQAMIVIKVPHIFPGVLNKYLIKDFDYNKEQEVDSVRGSFFLINREAYKKITHKEPYLDERYFIWFEEVDFCRQVKELGGKIYYTPQAQAIDLVGQSFKQLKRSRTQGYFRDSMLKYFKKWQAKWQYYILKILWAPINLLRNF